jgi:phosphoglycolate phosphatase
MCTATAAGMHAVGVAWGFRKVEELLENGAQSILQSPLDLLKLLECEADNL